MPVTKMRVRRHAGYVFRQKDSALRDYRNDKEIRAHRFSGTPSSDRWDSAERGRRLVMAVDAYNR